MALARTEPAACIFSPFAFMTGAMPTIFRFVLVCAALAGLGYGVLFALANWLEPAPREVTVTVPPSQYAK
jgi:hypothetical protein